MCVVNTSWLRRKCWARGNDDARNNEGAVAYGIFQFVDTMSLNGILWVGRWVGG